MLGKKIGCVKKLAKKGKGGSGVERAGEQSSQYEFLLREYYCDEEETSPSSTTNSSYSATTTNSTPTGFLAMYVGEERQRFVVPTGYLSHPLFKMLLEKAYNEFGFEQRNGLVVPCSVAAFQEVVSAVECCNGKFDFGNLVEEFV